MALGHALLLLTLMADGGVRMTLSEADSARACETSRDSVVRILTSSGRPPIQALCGRTRLRLTPFVHGTPAEAEVLRYRVRIPGERPAEGGIKGGRGAEAEGGGEAGFTVEPLADNEPCEAATEARPAVYCTRSAQRPVRSN